MINVDALGENIIRWAVFREGLFLRSTEPFEAEDVGHRIRRPSQMLRADLHGRAECGAGDVSCYHLDGLVIF